MAPREGCDDAAEDLAPAPRESRDDAAGGARRHRGAVAELAVATVLSL